MIAGIFSAIQLILKLLGLWDGFLSFVDQRRIADAEKKKQERDKAIDEEKAAKSEADFDKAQSDITRNLP